MEMIWKKAMEDEVMSEEDEVTITTGDEVTITTGDVTVMLC